MCIFLFKCIVKKRQIGDFLVVRFLANMNYYQL